MKPRLVLGWLLVGGAALACEARAEESPSTAPASGLQTATRLRLPAESLPAPATGEAPARQHPLVPALQYAMRAYHYARDNVRDYTCLIIKRERIEGDLHDAEYIKARVRTEHVEAGQAAQPYSVFLNFVAPARAKGRKVLYVAGRNDNQMLVRNGGRHFNFVTVKIDPNSEAAMKETLVPITRVGFASVTESLIGLIQHDMERDPAATNTRVKFYRRSKVNDRICTRVSVVHPQPDPGLGFAEANVYVDDELHVPIRVEALTWPRRSGEPKPLMFEYTYTDLRLNVGLTDADFRPSLLEQAR